MQQLRLLIGLFSAGQEDPDLLPATPIQANNLVNTKVSINNVEM